MISVPLCWGNSLVLSHFTFPASVPSLLEASTTAAVAAAAAVPEGGGEGGDNEEQEQGSRDPDDGRHGDRV